MYVWLLQLSMRNRIYISIHRCFWKIKFVYFYCIPFVCLQIQQTCKRMDSEICNVKWKIFFHIYQSTVKSRFFSSLAVNWALFTVSLYHETLWFLPILSVFSEARQNKLPKIPLRLWWEHLSFCMHWERHLLWYLRYLDICIFSLQDLQCSWKATKLFFAETRCFYMRNTVCVV